MTQLLRYQIRIESALGSPLRSDTLSGQILWAYREKHGEPALEELLLEVKDGNLPFVLSDGFPTGHLPVPTFPPIPRKWFHALANKHCGGDLFQTLQLQKSRKNELAHIPLEYWSGLRSNASLYALLDDWLPKVPKASWDQRSIAEMHNVIDRFQNTTLSQGGIFTAENTWMELSSADPSGSQSKKMLMDLYAQVRPDFQAEFDGLLEQIGKTGYGRDASIGLGQLRIERSEDVSNLLDCQGANRWLNLSTLATTDGTSMRDGYYKIRSKFGKVWSGFGDNAPFKKPILILEAGSILGHVPAPATTILQGVHPTNPKILQYTAGIFLPFVLNESISGE